MPSPCATVGNAFEKERQERQIPKGRSAILVGHEGFVIFCDPFLHLPLTPKDVPEVVVGQRVFWIEFSGLAILGNRSVRLSLPLKNDAKAIMGIRKGRFQFEGLLNCDDRFFRFFMVI